MPLSEDSLKILESVKKTGKPCKFVMVSKAAKPLSIVAFRKGSEQGYITEAKEAGSGTVVCGVVDTAPIEVQGANLSFKLQRAECDSPPVARSKLKNFLNEGSKSPWANPAIDIVDALPTVEIEGQGQDGQVQQGQTQQVQNQQPVKYRTGDEWKVVLAAVQQAQGDQAKTLVYQAYQEWKAENDRNKQALQTNANSQPDLDQQVILGKVEKILLTLGKGIKTETTQPTTDAQPQPKVQTPPTNTSQPNTANQPTTSTTSVQQSTPPTRPQPMPPVPQTPPSRRRQEQLEAAKEIRKTASDTTDVANGCKESPFAGANLQQFADEATVAAEKTRLGVHKDKILPTIHEAIKAANDLATHGQFALAHAQLLDAKQQWTVGKTAQEKERKAAIIPPTKLIHDNRIAEYDKIEPVLDAAIKKIAIAMYNLTETDNELCRAVRDMMAAHQKGAAGAINPHIVGTLESFLKLPGVPDTIAAMGKKLVQDATKVLQSEHSKRLGDAPSRQKKTELLLELVPTKGSDGGTSGTSEVQLARNFDKTVAFAFKPLDGESMQNDGDTLREVLTSNMCQKFKELSGLDLGFPEVSVENIGGRNGALIEGLNGHELPAEKHATMSGEDKARLNQLAQNLPPKELQKVLLSAIVSGDGDLKWDNVFIGTDGSSARRFDGGKGFPDQKTRAEIFLAESETKPKIPSTKVCALLDLPFKDATGSKSTLPGAKAPMSPDLVRDFLKIKDQLDELKTSMKQQAQTATRKLSTSDKPQQFDLQAIDQSVKSIEGAIKILEGNPQLTTEQFYTAFMTQRVLDMAEDYLGDQQTAINNYDTNAVQQSAQAYNLNPDLTIPVGKVRAIIQAGPQGFDEDRDSQELHDQFLAINQLLALAAHATADPNALSLDDWKKSAPIHFAYKCLNTPEMIALYWDGLGKLTKPEMAKLFQKLAFGGAGPKIPSPTEYPQPWYDKTAPDAEPRVITPTGKLKVLVPLSKADENSPWTIVKKPTADQIATGIRAQIK